MSEQKHGTESTLESMIIKDHRGAG